MSAARRYSAPKALPQVVVGLLALALGAGCGDVCQDAAQICADEMRVAAPREDATEAVECVEELEAHAQCIVDADSCAPDVVAACWAEVGGEPGAGSGGGS